MNIIPIDKELLSFKNHLSINERTIFSAKYGDGKTYFLNEFKKKYADEFVFITIYPVNYQIADNKEIFEYIKRDILIQMIRDGMISPSLVIPNSMIIQFFIMQRGGTLLSNLIEYAPLLGIKNPTKFVMAYKGIQSLFNVASSYKKYEKAIQEKDDAKIIELYTEEFSDAKGSPYEIDLITYLIAKNLDWYRTESSGKGKKFALIIEDLDRLDPAHLFRILNIFSAHLDRYYQCANDTITKIGDVSIENIPNKFGFDNVISVLDYETTEKTFKHFYGENSNYNGYIDKFLSHQPFFYSIRQVAISYLYKLIDESCHVKQELMPNRLKVVIEQLSIRNICRVIDDYLLCLDQEAIDTELFEFDMPVCSPLTRFLTIWVLMGIRKETIAGFLTEDNCNYLVRVIGPYWLSIKSIREKGGLTLGDFYYRLEALIVNRKIRDYALDEIDIPRNFPKIQKPDIQQIINSLLVYIQI